MLSQIDELGLIRQLLFVFQGISSENIKFSEKENSFCIDSHVSIALYCILCI